MNQPETHLLLQAFRALMTIAAPGVLLKAEAMVAPDILSKYLGAHDRYRPQGELAYDNELMVMLWSMAPTTTGELARAGRRSRGRARRADPPPVPQRLLRRRGARLARARGGVPERPARGIAGQRHRGVADRRRSRTSRR